MVESPIAVDGLLLEGKNRRCFWCGTDPLYKRYHDEEWGIPETDDQKLFEKLCLDGMQAGLSWLTILRRREGLRSAFAGFDLETMARAGEPEVLRLLGDTRVIRHRGKIEAVIKNAQAVLRLIEREGSFARFIWCFEPPPRERPPRLTLEVLKGLVQTDASRSLSKALRKEGCNFVGPTMVYAFMQAIGLVNDHLEGCHARHPVEAARKRLVRP